MATEGALFMLPASPAVIAAATPLAVAAGPLAWTVGGAVIGWKAFRRGLEYRNMQQEIADLRHTCQELLSDENKTARERAEALTQLLKDAAECPEKLVEVQKLVKELDEMDSTGECCVCQSEKATHAFVECGHMCACKECARRVMCQTGWGGQARCPICRTATHKCIEIFIV